MFRYILLLPLLFLFVVVLGLWFSLGKDSQRLPSSLLGERVISFSAEDLFISGRYYDRDIFLGRVSVLNVFASWCVPCVVEHSYLGDLARVSSAQIVGLNWRDRVESGRSFLAEHGNVYDIVVSDESGLVGIDWGVSGVPETYVIDGDGIIRFKYSGGLFEGSVFSDIVDLLVRLESEL